MNLKQFLITVLALCLISPVVIAQPREIKVQSTTVRKVNDSKAEELELPLAKAEDFFIKQPRIVRELRNNEQYASISINVASRIETRVKLKWEDTENVRLNGKEGLRYHVKANQPRTFTFTVYGPGEGIIQFTDEDDNLIAEVPYKIFRDGKFNHKVGVGINTSATELDRTRISGSYSLSRKKQYADDNTWSIRVGASANSEDLADFNINVQGSYQW